MSLVVGEIHDGRISLVADTKVTYAGDDRSTRHVFENAFPKVLILRDDLCVGLAGNDPEGVAESLLAVRSEPLEHVLVIAEALVHASFVVAALGPELRLLQIDQGSTQDRTEIGRAWVGDVSAYAGFQQRYSEASGRLEWRFRSFSSRRFSGCCPSARSRLSGVPHQRRDRLRRLSLRPPSDSRRPPKS